LVRFSMRARIEKQTARPSFARDTLCLPPLLPCLRKKPWCSMHGGARHLNPPGRPPAGPAGLSLWRGAWFVYARLRQERGVRLGRGGEGRGREGGGNAQTSGGSGIVTKHAKSLFRCRSRDSALPDPPSPGNSGHSGA
jgi:hypothetical protein